MIAEVNRARPSGWRVVARIVTGIAGMIRERQGISERIHAWFDIKVVEAKVTA